MTAGRIASIALLFFVLVIPAAVPAMAAADATGSQTAYPEFCREHIDRIEDAYRAGLEKAASDEERVACGRLRFAALFVLIELTYQSTLAWLAEDEDAQGTVRDDQQQWLAERELLILRAGQADGMTVAELASLSAELLERLRFFGAITDENFFPGMDRG